MSCRLRLYRSRPAWVGGWVCGWVAGWQQHGGQPQVQLYAEEEKQGQGAGVHGGAEAAWHA